MGESAESVVTTESEERVEENGEGASASTFLPELNLILIVCFLSLSGDEINSLETKMVDNVVRDDHRPTDHAVVADLHMKRRRVSEFKALGSRPIKFQTKIKDCRPLYNALTPSCRTVFLKASIMPVYSRAALPFPSPVTIDAASFQPTICILLRITSRGTELGLTTPMTDGSQPLYKARGPSSRSTVDKA
nr:uncharacterized protein LOC109163997 [Ipomoea batatas]